MGIILQEWVLESIWEKKYFYHSFKKLPLRYGRNVKIVYDFVFVSNNLCWVIISLNILVFYQVKDEIEMLVFLGSNWDWAAKSRTVLTVNIIHSYEYEFDKHFSVLPSQGLNWIGSIFAIKLRLCYKLVMNHFNC